MDVEPNNTRTEPSFMAAITAFLALSFLHSWMKRISDEGIP